jgi:hypothetical protein
MGTGAGNAIHFPEEKLPEELLDQSHLSLLYTKDATSYAILGSNQEMICVGYAPSDPDSISKVFKGVVGNKLFAQCSKASLAFGGGQFSLVTSAMSAENDLKSLFELHVGGTESAVESYPVGNSTMSVLELPIPEISENFLRSFPFGKIYSNRALVLKSLLRKWAPTAKSAIYAHVSSSFVDIYLLISGKLQLANTFSTRTSNDVLYFLLNVIEQVGGDVELDVHLSGQLGTNSEVLKLCSEHMKNVEIHFGFDNYKLSEAVSTVNKQHFSELFNLSTCVS